MCAAANAARSSRSGSAVPTVAAVAEPTRDCTKWSRPDKWSGRARCSTSSSVTSSTGGVGVESREQSSFDGHELDHRPFVESGADGALSRLAELRGSVESVHGDETAGGVQVHHYDPGGAGRRHLLGIRGAELVRPAACARTSAQELSAPSYPVRQT